jgi:hypothetical protein
MKTLTFILGITFSLTSWANTSKGVMLYGHLLTGCSNTLLDGGRPDFQRAQDISISVFLDDSLVTEHRSSATGNYAVVLDSPGKYTVVFSKEGYLSRTVLIDLSEAWFNSARSVGKLHGMFTLFSTPQNSNDDRFTNSPSHRAKFNESSDRMEWDDDFSRRAFDRMINVLQPMVSEAP